MSMRPGRRTSRLRQLAALVVTGALALSIASCSGGDDSTSESDSAGADGAAGAPAAFGTSEEAADTSSASTDEDSGASRSADATVSEVQLLSDRKQILRADLVVESDAVLTDARLAEAAVTAAGGVVTDEQTATEPAAPDRPTPYTVSTLTMRVPPEALNDLITKLGELGTLLSQSRGAEDVTDEYVDVQARLESQRASLDRLLALVTDAADLTDVVTLENEISRRQSDLDALSARLQALDELVTLATVTLTLTSEASDPVAAQAGFMTGLRSGWDAFTGAIVGGLTVFGAVLPFAIALAVIGIPLYALRSRRRGSATPVTVPAPPPA